MTSFLVGFAVGVLLAATLIILYGKKGMALLRSVEADVKALKAKL